jgi:hypothetical protein
MKQRNQTMLKTLGVAMMLVGANAAMAETVTVPASVTVNNAIDFTFTGALDFGQVRATPAAAVDECAGLVMGLTNTTLTAATTGTGFDLLCTDTDGALQSVGGTPTRPVFTIAGVAPFATLTLTLPAPTVLAAVNLTAATGPGTPQFKLTDFTARKTSGTAANIAGTTFLTDADGGATFTVGATLITEVAATTGTYQDMVYSGEFDVSVDY